MSKPFQFSMRRLFLAVALFCVITWLLRVAWDFGTNNPESEWPGIIATLLVIVSVLGLGAAIGAISGNITDGVIGFPLMVVILLVIAAFTFGTSFR